MIYIKEYGARRTFTNYFCVLVQKNFKDVMVLPSPLGSKHLEPLDYQVWVTNQTQKPRFNTPGYKALVADLAANLDKIKFAILIKDPYAWLISIITLRHRQGNKKLPKDHAKHKSMLESFNRRYRVWKKWHEAHKKRSIVLRYEDVLRDFSGALRKLEQKFGLKRRHKQRKKFANVTNKVNQCERIHKSGFKKVPFYKNRKYLQHAWMTPRMKELITKTIDWKLMAWYGYKHEPIIGGP